MRKRLITGVCVMVIAMNCLTGCAADNKVSNDNDIENVAIAEESVEPELVNIDDEEVYIQLMHDNFDSIEILSHSAVLADESINENGRYDIADKVSVKLSFTDEFNVSPQHITKDVLFARDASVGQWEIIKENCKKWDAEYKKLGGTSWKMVTDDGDIYFRLRDTIEFFHTQTDAKATRVEETEFSTTILGAMYMKMDGEYKLRRIHILSGILTDDGRIIIKPEFVGEDETMEILLNDCEKIERDELPFTEEEFRETSDQRG